MVGHPSAWKFRSLGAVAAVCLAVYGLPAVAAQSGSLQSFVQENIEKGYSLLNNDSLSDAQRSAQFRNLMLSLVDTQRIGRFTLGPYANGVSPADLAAFENAFTDYALAVYETRLGQFKDVKIRVTGINQLAADDAVVNAELTGPALPTNDPIRVGFRVRSAAGGRRVLTDMEVEGVWLALWERSDFTSFLQQHGGNVAALTEHLRSQARQLEADLGMTGASAR